MGLFGFFSFPVSARPPAEPTRYARAGANADRRGEADRDETKNIQSASRKGCFATLEKLYAFQAREKIAAHQAIRS
jgi:hypothetical protein